MLVAKAGMTKSSKLKSFEGFELGFQGALRLGTWTTLEADQTQKTNKRLWKRQEFDTSKNFGLESGEKSSQAGKDWRVRLLTGQESYFFGPEHRDSYQISAKCPLSFAKFAPFLILTKG